MESALATPDQLLIVRVMELERRVAELELTAASVTPRVGILEEHVLQPGPLGAPVMR